MLITQRSATMSQPLLWEFPGGKVEAGESEAAALAREIKEELALEVEPLQRLTPVRYTYKAFEIELIPYICRYKGGTLHLLEHQAYKWVAAEALLQFDWCPADKPIVAEYLRLRSIASR